MFFVNCQTVNFGQTLTKSSFEMKVFNNKISFTFHLESFIVRTRTMVYYKNYNFLKSDWLI